MLNKGLSMAKTMLVTGFVISSAPLVLSPLVVISVIGFACSVPSGLLLASYVCIEKLMNKLLPGPKPPAFLLGYGTVSTNEEFENREEDNYVRLKGDIDMGKEEEMAYQENFEKYEGEMEEEPAREIEVTVEGVRKAEEKEPIIKERLNQPTVDEVNVIVVNISGDERSGVIVKEEGAPEFEVKNLEVQLCHDTDMKEIEELVSETKGLLTKIRDEGISNILEENMQSLEKLLGDAKEEQKVNRNDYDNIRIEKPQRVTELKVEESTNNKIFKESSYMKETGHVENVKAMPEKTNPGETVGGLLEKGDVDDSLKSERSTVEIVGTTNIGNTTEEEKPKVEKPAMLQGGRSNNDISNNAVQDNQLEINKEIVILTNAYAREFADESGFDLYYSRHAVEENKKYSSYSLETTDNTDLPVSAIERESNNTAGISPKKDLAMTSSKVILYTEKKMWQQIDSMQKIVGCKAAKHPTCFEELKALYLFTGVEPPAPFKDPSDLQEMKDKLRFLMAAVGVK